MKEEEKKEKQRTLTQNRALHLYFQFVADTLNSAGLDMKKVLKPTIDILWTKYSIKEYLWKSVQNVMFGKESTKTLTTKEIDIVYDQLNKFLSEKFGISVPFPSLEELIWQEEFKSKKDKNMEDSKF